MNTMMWEHPVTRPQLELLESWGYFIIPPVVKTLVCGDTGTGAMASVENIEQTIVKLHSDRTNPPSAQVAYTAMTVPQQ